MSHQGPNGGNLHSCTNNGIVNSGQQDPGLHGTCLHPGPSSQLRHIPARPIFYVHAPAPPPLPFLHYQWPLPMPLFYNPIEGFPGIGYGIIMPPFPPYMETPAYIMPHPHIQPLDYRRLLHPQVHAPTAPYQNPNQSRRIRPPHSVATETTNSEVQTEPTQTGGDDYGDRSPHVRSDSGHGTASVSPTSSSCSQKQDSAESVNVESPNQQVKTLASSNVKDFQVNNTSTDGTVKHDFNILRPTGTKTVQLSMRATLEEQKNHKDSGVQANVPPCHYGHCSMWSVSSSDSMVPVCSSFQQDEVVKRKHASISDIQINWGSGTIQGTVLKMSHKMLPENDELLSSENPTGYKKSLNHSQPAEGLLVAKDSECLYKILKLPLVQSRENGNEIYQMSSNSCQMRKKFNESVWSVESLPPFIPTKEWLTQNSMIETEVLVEMVEEAENCGFSTQNDNASKELGETRRFSLCDSIATKSFCSPEKGETLLNSPAVEKMLPTGLLIVKNGVDIATEDGICAQLCIPVADLKMAEVSPKGHLVDCGIQCNKLQEMKCLCEEMKSSTGPNRLHHSRISDKTNGGSTEAFYMNGHMQKNQKRPSHWRNRGAEKPSSQQVPYTGRSGKPGKRGGRNHQ